MNWLTSNTRLGNIVSTSVNLFPVGRVASISIGNLSLLVQPTFSSLKTFLILFCDLFRTIHIYFIVFTFQTKYLRWSLISRLGRIFFFLITHWIIVIWFAMSLYLSVSKSNTVLVSFVSTLPFWRIQDNDETSELIQYVINANV